jgi:hypothetical protein
MQGKIHVNFSLHLIWMKKMDFYFKKKGFKKESCLDLFHYRWKENEMSEISKLTVAVRAIFVC